MKDIQTQTLLRHTVTIPLSQKEISDLENMLRKTGLKKGIYIKNLIINDLKKKNEERL